MKIACVSLNPMWENKEQNFNGCAKAVDFAVKNSCSLTLFPEMTLTGFSMNFKVIAEDLKTSKTIAFFRQQAEKGINIIFGLALKSNDLYTNNLIMVAPEGQILANYAKIHPFSYSGEGEYFSGGEKIEYSSINKMLLGFTICYDLRFPEIYQALSRVSQIIVNIANWPENRIDHWNTLLKARAIENQVYMIGVNREGIDDNGIEYFRGSQVFDPEGNIVSPIHTWEDVDIFEIDTGLAQKVRENFPVKADRKSEFYKNIL